MNTKSYQLPTVLSLREKTADSLDFLLLAANEQ